MLKQSNYNTIQSKREIMPLKTCFSVFAFWKMIGQSHVRAVAHAGLMVWHWYELMMHKCIQALEVSMNEQQPLVRQWSIKLKFKQFYILYSHMPIAKRISWDFYGIYLTLQRDLLKVVWHKRPSWSTDGKKDIQKVIRKEWK